MIDRPQNNAMTFSAYAQGAGNRQSGGLHGALATARQAGAEQAEGDRQQLPEADQRQVQKLKQRDREVRAHGRWCGNRSGKSPDRKGRKTGSGKQRRGLSIRFHAWQTPPLQHRRHGPDADYCRVTRPRHS